MKLTNALKSHIVAAGKCKEGDDDAAFKLAAADMMFDGTLTREKFEELTANDDAKGHDELLTMLRSINGRLERLETGGQHPAGSDRKAASDLNAKLAGAGTDGDGTVNVRVKSVTERYSGTKSAAVYPDRMKSNGQRHIFAGQQVYDGSGNTSRPLDNPSELDKAGAGVFLKWLLSCEKSGAPLPRQLRFQGDVKNPKGETHDEQMLLWMLKECKWGGNIGGEGSELGGSPVMWRHLNDMEIKQVIDDTTSGGQYITPIMFDDMVVLPTLLYGEFYPKVTVVPVTRGRRIESGTVGEWSVNSGGGDGTNITLTTTSGFISAFNTVIYTGDMGILLGLDFLSDSPVDLANILMRQAGEKMMEWLDEQICVGDGTTEPEGITVASGTTGVLHSSAAPTIGVYVQHLLNVGKEYTQGTAVNRLSFGGTQTSYRRARSIQVGASDARLIFGNEGLASYTLFDGFPYGINSALGNTKVFFGNLSRYRMYRRLGLEMSTDTSGYTLRRANEMLLTGRFRFGGQVEDGAAFTVATDAQS